MRARSAAALIAILLPAALAAQQPTSAAPANILSAEETAAGFRLLFDGSSTAGWRGFRRPVMDTAWRAVDGLLTVAGRAGDIVTVDQYRNFELRLDWRVPSGGNSGIMYHVTEDQETPWKTGPEMALLDDARHPDNRSRLTSAGACHSVYAAPSGVVRAAGEWNEARVVVNGPHVEHWLNGVKVVEYQLWSDDWRQRVQASKFAQWPSYGMSPRGHISLQGDHGGVQFRSIRIRVLP